MLPLPDKRTLKGSKMNSINIKIRKVMMWDVEDLQSIGRETFSASFGAENSASDMQKYLDENFNTEKVKSELENPDAEFYFAETDQQVVGYLKINCGNAQTETSLKNALEIERIYVLPKYQGQRVGQLLFNKALEIAKSKAMENLWLGVWEKNPKAIRFYEKNGFVAFGQHVFRLGDDIQTDIMMKLALKK